MKKLLRYGVPLVAVPMAVALGAVLPGNGLYMPISLAVAVLSCVPFFAAYEAESGSSAKRLVVLAVMVSLSVSGRFFFSFVPFFKPVTAVVVITALFFGSETGFVCGALSALLSNIHFGQGPWTPFQMFAWGLIGLLAGLLSKKLLKSRVALAVFGAFAGVLFTVVTDIWSVLWVDGYFNFPRYAALFVTALQATITYAVSNAVFLLVLTKPIGNKLKRIKTKYGL